MQAHGLVRSTSVHGRAASEPHRPGITPHPAAALCHVDRGITSALCSYNGRATRTSERSSDKDRAGAPRARVSSRLAPFGTTIFAEMSALAVATGAVNLGQGFPEGPGPELLRNVAVAAIEEGDNQYPPGPGVRDLLEAVAEHQEAEYGLVYDPGAEILVTAGATEAVAAAVIGLCEPGDEVLMLEPSYDSYAPVVAMAGAVRVPVRLYCHGDHWELPAGALEAAVTDRSRLLLLNSPHNPSRQGAQRG